MVFWPELLVFTRLFPLKMTQSDRELNSAFSTTGLTISTDSSANQDKIFLFSEIFAWGEIYNLRERAGFCSMTPLENYTIG